MVTPKTGTTSEILIEKLNSLLTLAEESQLIISRHDTYLEDMTNVINHLTKLEEKLDYIKNLPERKKEKELVERLTEEKEKLQKIVDKKKEQTLSNTEKSVESNTFKRLEKPLNIKFRMPTIE